MNDRLLSTCDRCSSPNSDFECSSFIPPISSHDLVLHRICANKEQCVFTLSSVRDLDVLDSRVHDILLEVKNRLENVTDRAYTKRHLQRIMCEGRFLGRTLLVPSKECRETL